MIWNLGRSGLGLAFLLLLPGIVFGQRGTETGIHALATFADFTFAGGGGHFGLRPGGRTRLSIAAALGSIEGDLAFRGEGTAQFLLNPASRTSGFYAGGGLAGLTGPIEEAYLVLVVGMETSPGGGSGWVLEGGVGGGLRVLLGYRWRRMRR